MLTTHLPNSDSPVLSISNLISKLGVMKQRQLVNNVVLPKSDTSDERVLSSRELLEKFKELHEKRVKLDSEVEKSEKSYKM